ncbi:D-alanyl-D-alanine carboxypeptidase family protein [Collinsella tanakaei]|uniref:D-alanyl-D-alanine carboxypeptidase family protein n=1 Tax=Collinsella tanakaei TaxID=626935 RepID=UPI0025A3872A|nr:D-alanyl-D-alanine carboxypeptidase [Collinsella tanakaei]MDM8300485.1 D-alanyl-D-alanine carboxypeptidase [Collinsella tanakaei]
MSRLHTSRALPRRAAYLAACIALGASVACFPATALASQPDTDIICGAPESERQDAAEDRPDISARNAIVVGQDGTVYYERDADKQVKIASITKVMTAIVALENADLDDEVVVDHEAATVGQSSADLREGDVLTMEEALRALLIPSGNDAGMAIASTVGAIIDPKSDDPYAVFIQAMNDKAAELGMDSKFTNPHGLDFDGWEGDMHSSARDVATMFAYAMKNDTFRSLTASDENVIEVTGADGEERSIAMIERNTILGKEGNIGGKTGGTYDALQCFVGAFSRENGGEVYTVVLGCDGDKERFADTLTLANWYYDHVVAYPVTTSTVTAMNGAPLVARVPHADWTDKDVDVTVVDPEATVPVFSLAGDVEQDIQVDTVSGNVTEGQKLGTLTLTQDGREIASVELVSAENQNAPDPVSWVLVQIDRLVRLVTGDPADTDTEIVSEPVAVTELDAA